MSHEKRRNRCHETREISIILRTLSSFRAWLDDRSSELLGVQRGRETLRFPVWLELVSGTRALTEGRGGGQIILLEGKIKITAMMVVCTFRWGEGPVRRRTKTKRLPGWSELALHWTGEQIVTKLSEVFWGKGEVQVTMTCWGEGGVRLREQKLRLTL